MSIGRDEVLHVAKLAELAVREEDLARLVGQLNRIVDYVAQLNEVPTDRMTEPFLPGPAAATDSFPFLGQIWLVCSQICPKKAGGFRSSASRRSG